MKAFLDTSVLIATFYSHHQFHQPSIDLFLHFRKSESSCGVHSLAEIYSSLTGRTGRERVSGEQAMLFLENVREHLTIVSLDHQDFFRAVEASSGFGVSGGAIYDSLLAHCALKVKAQAIYTWNTKDFVRFGKAIAERVRTPPYS
jgi:predicted nucleic acid-binding protein